MEVKLNLLELNLILFCITHLHIIGIRYEKPPAPNPCRNWPTNSIGRLIKAVRPPPTRQRMLNIREAWNRFSLI